MPTPPFSIDKPDCIYIYIYHSLMDDSTELIHLDHVVLRRQFHSKVLVG